METKTISPFTIPGAIILAGAIIAVAVIWTKQPATTTTPTTQKEAVVTIDLSPITSSDHIFGNPAAPIKIVEYSDPSCPYCKTFNTTMEEIISKYGVNGDVAWIYRHYPLDKPSADGYVLHKNAGNEAHAMECAADLGGNDKFWAFEKKLYETTPSVTGKTPDGLDQAQLPIIAKALGIDVTAFNDCLSSGKFKDTIEKQFVSGVTAGVSGTPSSFMVLQKPVGKGVTDYIGEIIISYKIPTEMLHVANGGKMIFMNGALPEELISGLIGAILADK